jgi:hypothetical protein
VTAPITQTNIPCNFRQKRTAGIANAKPMGQALNGRNRALYQMRHVSDFARFLRLLPRPGNILSHPGFTMTNREQNRALRAAILSLQSGMLTILEFLDILAAQSTDPKRFRQHIQAIRASIQLLDDLPPLSTEEERSQTADSPETGLE